MRIILVMLALGANAAFAGDPAPPPGVGITTAPVAQPACPGSQRCGDQCIAWTEVCTAGLADSVGLVPPEPTPAGAPANIPVGSSIVTAPSLHDEGRPRMKAGAPSYCRDGSATANPWLSLGCLSYYETGTGAGAARAPTLDPACPLHRRCEGACLPEGEVCVSMSPHELDSNRLTPYGE